MAVTLSQYLDAIKWRFLERGDQVMWNELKQIANSQSGSGVTAGTTVLGTADITAGTGLQTNNNAGLDGPFAATGVSEASTASHYDKPRPDPGGNYGPTPQRLSFRVPTGGFRA